MDSGQIFELYYDRAPKDVDNRKGGWFLRGERGVTYADTLPPGSELLAGAWWPAGYTGPPLVSLDQQAADVLGLKVGDMLTGGDRRLDRAVVHDLRLHVRGRAGGHRDVEVAGGDQSQEISHE